jgi:hypothetical protein
VSGNRLYRRTQIAWPGVVPVVFVSALLIWTFVETQLAVALAIVLAVLAITLLLFASLTVTVTDRDVLASFGVGLIRKRVALADVLSFMRVRNSWMNGWGIHGYPGGMLYNASGLSGVEFKLADGRYVCIGTGEPDALVAALQQATGRAEAPSHEPRAERKRGMSQAIGAAIGVAALVFAAVIVYTGLQPPAVTLTDDDLHVSSGMYSNTVPYTSIQTATLQDTIPRIRLRTNGFGAGNTLRGSFSLESWGNGRLYINRDVPPFVVIRTGNNFVVVNFTEPQRTRTLYTDLTARLSRSRR